MKTITKRQDEMRKATFQLQMAPLVKNILLFRDIHGVYVLVFERIPSVTEPFSKTICSEKTKRTQENP